MRSASTFHFIGFIRGQASAERWDRALRDLTRVNQGTLMHSHQVTSHIPWTTIQVQSTYEQSEQFKPSSRFQYATKSDRKNASFAALKVINIKNILDSFSEVNTILGLMFLSCSIHSFTKKAFLIETHISVCIF